MDQNLKSYTRNVAYVRFTKSEFLRIDKLSKALNRTIPGMLKECYFRHEEFFKSLLKGEEVAKFLQDTAQVNT